MTTEDDFQALLDRNPDDHATRLVFADWLEERGDVRAEGYRALGQLRRCAGSNRGNDRYVYWFRVTNWPEKHTLPRLWWDRFFDIAKKEVFTRRECEDAAAVAFSNLDVVDRQQLLKGIS